MGRLIGIDSLKGCAIIRPTSHESIEHIKQCGNDILNHNDIPTAYDVDAVVKQLEEEKGIAFLTLANTGNKTEDIAYDEVMAYLNKIIEIVNELAEEYKGGWITCSEILPEEKEKVLACINPNVAKHEIIITERINSKDEYWHDGTILAWMPLPAPYTEGE